MMFGTSSLLKSAHIDSDRSQQQRLADRLDHLVAVNADHPEQLGDEHQQQDPRQALHHPLQRLLHHLVDRIVEIHSRQLVKRKPKVAIAVVVMIAGISAEKRQRRSAARYPAF